MAKTSKQHDEFLEPMRDEDLSTLQALEQKIHALFKQKRKDERPPNPLPANQAEISAECPGVKIGPDLLALVGVHPENLIDEDKLLIRQSITRKLTDQRSLST
jgi:hypothetical protein